MRLTTARENRELAKDLMAQLPEFTEDFPVDGGYNDPEIEISENGLECTLTINDESDEPSDGYNEYTFHVKLVVTGQKDYEKYEDNYPTHKDYQQLREG